MFHPVFLFSKKFAAGYKNQNEISLKFSFNSFNLLAQISLFHNPSQFADITFAANNH